MDGVADHVAAGVDLGALIRAAQTAPPMEAPARPAPAAAGAGLRIGIARDAAFGFYYADDLEAFSDAGAQLVPVDMIHDTALPADLDGLFIGGGFPETQAEKLSANRSMRESVRAMLSAGLPAYAECGGLMYLTRSIRWQGQTHQMAGLFDADTVVRDRPQGRGYVRFRAGPEPLWAGQADEVRAHEFHYAQLENVEAPVFARGVTRGHGIDGTHDALVKANTQAGFIHLRHSRQSPWVTDFLGFVSRVKTQRGCAA